MFIAKNHKYDIIKLEEIFFKGGFNMKKFISILLTGAMLAVPVYGQDYSQEEIVSRAKEICNIGTYDDFNISSGQDSNGNVTYSLAWNNNNGNFATISIAKDGTIYSYYTSDNNSNKDKNLCSDDIAKNTADNFLKKAVGEKYTNFKYDHCDYNNVENYTFCYKQYCNGIESTENIFIDVNKYTNKVTGFNYPSFMDTAKYDNTEGVKTKDEAKKVINNGLNLGYVSDYDYDTKTINIKPVYKFNNYLLNAKTLEPVEHTHYEGAGSAKGEASVEDSSTNLTPEETTEIESHKNSISVDKAIEIINNTLGVSISKDKITTYYSREYFSRNFTLSIYSNDSNSSYFYAKVDNKGRILYYGTDNSNNTGKTNQSDLRTIAENIINKLNVSNYKLSPVTTDADSYGYTYTCNVMRNGYYSFDELISVTLDAKGNVTGVSADYLNDQLFSNIDANYISKDKAIEFAYDGVKFGQYYSYINNNANAIPVYAFENDFTIDAYTGKILDINGLELDSDTGLRNYVDVSDQWYADIVNKMSYMGYGYNSNEFRGNDPLTGSALNELLGYNYIGKNKLNNNITRYELADILMDIMNCSNATKYNDAFVKPYDDVDFKHTGAVAVLKSAGIVNGDSFRGDDVATRAEALVMYYRYVISQ